MLSMLFNLLLANAIMLLYFSFLFCAIFQYFFQISIVIEKKCKTKTCAQITVANNAIDIPPYVPDNTMKDLSK